MHHDRFGIYVNLREKKAVRINSPYWIPSGAEWVLLTPEVNATLVRIRELARERNLIDQPEQIVWGEIPHQES